ncbi:MAG TPA: substrate-binding domain-containing protein [Parvibaculum sp.]
MRYPVRALPFRSPLLAALIVAGLLAANSAAATDIDDRFQPYHAGGGSGTFKAVSSDALKGVMTVWSEDYADLNPGIRISVESATSSKAAEELASGDADLAPMTRQMTWDEKSAFQRRHGYAPLEIRIGVEAVAFFVNKDNPVSCLPLARIGKLFSGASLSWGDLGLTGAWASRAPAVFARNADADISTYVDEVALSKQGLGGGVKQEQLSSAVVHAIAGDTSAIGYASAGYRISGVKPIAVSGVDGACLMPNERNAYARTYPLAHFLYLYADRNPSGDKNRPLADFMAYTLSLDGQKTIVYAGYFPPPYVYVNEDLGKLGSR